MKQLDNIQYNLFCTYTDLLSITDSYNMKFFNIYWKFAETHKGLDSVLLDEMDFILRTHHISPSLKDYLK